jgi:hypothetical protein
MNDECLDPEEFPFTADETLQALQLWIPDAEARQLLEGMTEVSRLNVAHKSEQAKRFPEVPSTTPRKEIATLKLADYTQFEWLWPALSVLSPSSAARVEEWMKDHWRREYLLTLISTNRDAAMAAGLYPPREQEIERLRAEGANVDRYPADIEIFDPRIQLPPPTEEMRDAVTYLIEGQRHAWQEFAEESKRRLDASRSFTGSPPEAPPRP